jgi:hypothetical protein
LQTICALASTFKTHISDDSLDKSRGKSKSKREIKCFYCSKQGHIKRECRKFKRDQLKEKGEELKEEKDIATVAFDGDDLVVCEDVYVNLEYHESMQVVDVAASFYIMSHRDFFSSDTSGNFG